MESCGCIVCLATAIAGYFTGGIICSIHSIYYRTDIISNYKVDVKDEIVCCVCFDVFYRAICFPCTYFQIYNSLKLWENTEAESMIANDAVISRDDSKTK